MGSGVTLGPPGVTVAAGVRVAVGVLVDVGVAVETGTAPEAGVEVDVGRTAVGATGVNVAVGGACVGVAVAGGGLGTLSERSSKHTWLVPLTANTDSSTLTDVMSVRVVGRETWNGT